MNNTQLMQKEEIETFYPTSKAAWRAWLQENHETKQIPFFFIAIKNLLLFL
jgi:hypothetical protein